MVRYLLKSLKSWGKFPQKCTFFQNRIRNTVIVVVCTRFTGMNVIEVAHDMQAQVAKYVTGTLKVVNSYDTWHGTYGA